MKKKKKKTKDIQPVDDKNNKWEKKYLEASMKYEKKTVEYNKLLIKLADMEQQLASVRHNEFAKTYNSKYAENTKK
jgi:hypothetical protein